MAATARKRRSDLEAAAKATRDDLVARGRARDKGEIVVDTIDESDSHVSPPSASARASAIAFARQTIGTKGAYCRVVCSDEPIATIWVLERGPEQFALAILDACARDAMERPRGTRPAYYMTGYSDDGRPLTGDRVFFAGQAHVPSTAIDEALRLDVSGLDPSASGQIAQQMRHTERIQQLSTAAWGTVVQTLRQENERQAARIAQLEQLAGELQERIAQVATQEHQAKAEAAMVAAKAENMRHLGSQLIQYVPLALRHFLGAPEAGKSTPRLAPPAEAQGAPLPDTVARALVTITDDQMGRVRGALGAEQLDFVERARRGEKLGLDAVGCMQGLSDESIATITEVLTTEQLLPILDVMQAWEQASRAQREDEAARA